MSSRYTILLATIALVGGLTFGCERDNPTASNTDPHTNDAEAALAEAPTLEELEAEVLREVEGTPAKGDRATAWVNEITGPTVIDQPGVYRLTADFSTDGDGIVVQSGRVVVLLGHRTITGPGAKEGRGVVVESATHVHIVGGRFVNLGIAVELNGTSRSSVQGIAVEGADEFADPANGIPPQIGVLLLNSAHNRVAWNRIDLVNLGIFVRGGGSYRNDVALNRVTGGDLGLLAVCYNPAPNAGPEGPSHDEIFLNHFSRFQIGVQFNAGSDNRASRNLVEYFVAPYEDPNGTNFFVNNRTKQIEP